MRRFLILTLIATVFSFAFFANDTFAQTPSISLSISSSPLNPKPLESVNLTVSSYDIDLNRASITWTYNGQTIDSGTGRTRTTVTAPATGSTGIITVSASSTGLATGSATLALQPGNVDLLWEAVDSYTPPFYKGKALPVVNATIQVTAVPTINSPKQQSFTWTRNGIAQQSSSGYDKSSYLFQNNELQRTEEVRVSSSGGFFNGESVLKITPRTPSLVAYQKYEGFVDYANGATSSVNMSGPGAVLVFEPYYFSVPQNIATNLSIDMSVDGEGLGSLIPPNELRLTRPENGGISSLKVAITTAVYSLQNLNRTFNLIFN